MANRTVIVCPAVAWAASTTYAVGNRVANDTNKIYTCTTGGQSAGSGGPTGTGTGISDNACVWDYVVTRDYSAMSTALATEDDTYLDLVTNTMILTFECYSGAQTADGAYNSGSAWTPSSSYYLNITVPAGERHAGVWSDAKYRVSSSTSPAVNLAEQYTCISHVQINGTGYIALQPGPSNFTDSVIAKGASRQQVYFPQSVTVCQNTISYGAGRFNFYLAVNVTLLNCTSYGATSASYKGIQIDAGTVKNCVSCGNAGGDFSTGGTVSYNASGDTTATGTGSITGIDSAAVFNDPTNKDFSLKSGTNALVNAGTNTGAPSTDIIGTSRPQETTVDIGAYERVYTAPSTGGAAIFNPYDEVVI